MHYENVIIIHHVCVCVWGGGGGFNIPAYPRHKKEEEHISKWNSDLTLIVQVVQICTHRPGMPVVQICIKKT